MQSHVQEEMSVEEEELREESQNQFLLFTKGLLQGRANYYRQKQAFDPYKETVTLLGEILPRGVLSFLVYGEGWKARKYNAGRTLETGRIWDTEEFQDLDLSFSENSIEILLHLFGKCQEMAIEGTVHGEVKNISLSGTPSEKLLVHLCTRPLTKDYPALVESLSGWNGWNQLLLAIDPSIEVATSRKALRTTIEEWGWAFPWLATDIATHWVKVYKTLFDGRVLRYQTVLSKLHLIFETLNEFARKEGRPDWLLPIMEFFRLITEGDTTPEETAKPLERLISEESHVTRQGYRDEWANLLRFMSRMEYRRVQTRKLHPVDREGAHRVLLSWWEENNMVEALRKVEALREHLENVVG